MDVIYEDNLDKKISSAFYARRFAEYSKQLEDLELRIAKHNRADINYYEFGRRILELVENAEKLIVEAYPDEKRELTQFLLSNSTLKDGESIFALKTPYSAIAKHAPYKARMDWQGR